MTMAMQRAKPIKINPTMYSKWPERKIIAKRNMRIGPMIQFWTKERARTL
jgi:NADH:ubiquinone oxidoreductase subunit H